MIFHHGIFEAKETGMGDIFRRNTGDKGYFQKKHWGYGIFRPPLIGPLEKRCICKSRKVQHEKTERGRWVAGRFSLQQLRISMQNY